MGSLERRIQQLEELYQVSAAADREAAGRGRKELANKAIVGMLNAMANIRRAPIDEEPWRYEVENLRGLGPFTIATYIAALGAMGHPDEARAREVLAEVEADRGIEDSPLWEMIEGLIATSARMREDIERGA